MPVIERNITLISIFAAALLLSAFVAGDVSAMPPFTGDNDHSMSLSKVNSINETYAELQGRWIERGVDQPADIDFKSWLGSTASTSKNILCILVKFPDKANITDAAFFDTLAYSSTGPSVRHYYNEVSFDQLDIVTVEMPSDLGWVTVSNNYSYYVGSDYGTGAYPNNCQKLVEEAVDLVDPVVNFADYDNDSDGYVDGLMVVHAGRGAELSHSSGDIWSHKWAISPRYRDGKYVFTYSMMPEYWYSASDMTIGVFCHELGHVFGLPDLYDTDYSSNGIGKWSIMAAGSWNGYLGDSPAHFDAWCRLQLGFTAYTNITTTSYGTDIPSVENSGTIFRLWTNGTASDEHFLVENRQKTGYDSALPGNGLLIWHVDDNVNGNDNEWYPGHTTYGHYGVALVQADGNWSLEKALSHGDAGDPYPGSSNNTEFTPLTTPNSDSYSGANTLVAVSDISASGDTMTADFVVSFAAGSEDDDPDEWSLPAAFDVQQNYPNPFNGTTRIQFTVSASSEVELDIYNLLGQTVWCTSEEVSPGSHFIDWDATDAQGNELPAGVYFYRLKAGSQNSVKKMLYLK